MEKGYKDKDIFAILNPLVKKWFLSKFDGFCEPQKYGVMPIHSRENILISSPTGSGKCITPDETILINNNGKVELLTGIELSKIHANGKIVTTIGKTGVLKEMEGIKSFSLKNQKIKQTKALFFEETYKGDIFEVKTEYGRSVKLSPEHPLLTEENGWVKAGKLTIGQKIAVPRSLNLPEQEIYLENDRAIAKIKTKVRTLIDYSRYCYLRKTTNNFSIINDTYDELLCLTKNSLKTISRKLNIGLTTAFRIVHGQTSYEKERFDTLLLEEANKVKFAKNRVIVKNKSTKIYSFLKPAKITPELAQIVAFIQAEGLIGKYEKGKRIVISQINRTTLLKSVLTNMKNIFDIEFTKKNEIDYAINLDIFATYFQELLSLQSGRGRNTQIPNWLLNSKREIKKEYLKTFFSLEAEVSKNEIKITQANKQKIEVINYLCLSFGIFPAISTLEKYASNTPNKTRRKYYGLTIRKIKNLKLFLEKIDIIHPSKSKLLNHINKKVSGEYVEKHQFDYSKISSLSKYYSSYEEFYPKFKSSLEVCRRAGYLTETALIKLKGLLYEIKTNSEIETLIKDIDAKLNSDIIWLKIKSIEKIKYNGKLVDLTVPDIQNFIGGTGGIYLHNTLTAFLSILNELVDSAEKGILKDKVYAIYISPLKALGTDIKHNLIEPLNEIQELAGKDFGIRIATRTGDTTQYERQKLLKNVPHILITTPESLALMLASPKFKNHLSNVDWAIIDEIHAMAENKRGVHLSLFLEHLQYHSPGLTRVGLSATVSPIDEVARYLVGNRDCKVVDISFLKELDLKVLSPVKDLVNTDYHHIRDATYHKIHELIQAHKTTLIFTNTRAGTERIVHTLKERFPKKYYELDDKNPDHGMSLIGAHHGSLSKLHRTDVEQQLRDGKLRAVSCSTSLELGIDIGSIDLVILLGSPKSVARALQRAGRSGHRLHATTKARILVMDRDDLIECSVLLKNALEHKIDRIHIPQNSYDVLVQHVLGFVLNSDIQVDELYEITKQSYCYQNLKKEDFLEVVQYLCGAFPTLENRNIFSKIRMEGDVLRRKGVMTRVIYSTNLGTIPSSGGILVKVGDYVIGMIDEGFLEKLKRGDTFVLGGDVYEFAFARGMTAQVKPASHKTPTVPRWYSESLPLSFDLANSIQVFRGKMYDLFEKKSKKEEMMKYIHDYLYVEDIAAQAIYNYMQEQYRFKPKQFPRNDTFVVEQFHDQIFNTQKHYHIFHSLNGRRVNEVLSRVFAEVLGKYHYKDIEVGVNDNGFYLAANHDLDIMQLLKIDESYFEVSLRNALENSEVLRRRFRHCAERSLMILRSYKGHVKRAGKQQVSSMILLKAAKKISKDFIILREAYREVVEDLMDVINAKKVFSNIKKGAQKLDIFDTAIPSPFATNLVLQSYSDVVTIEDRHKFLQSMHAHVLAKIKDPGTKVEKFSYEKYWKKKEQIREFTLKDDLIMAFKKRKVPVDFRLEVLNCVEDKDKILSEKATEFFDKEFSKEVHKAWTDKAYHFIKKLL